MHYGKNGNLKTEKFKTGEECIDFFFPASAGTMKVRLSDDIAGNSQRATIVLRGGQFGFTEFRRIDYDCVEIDIIGTFEFGEFINALRVVCDSYPGGWLENDLPDDIWRNMIGDSFDYVYNSSGNDVVESFCVEKDHGKKYEVNNF